MIPTYLPPPWRDITVRSDRPEAVRQTEWEKAGGCLRQMVITDSGRHKEGEGFFRGDDTESSEILDTTPDESLHRITAMAAGLFSAPISAGHASHEQLAQLQDLPALVTAQVELRQEGMWISLWRNPHHSGEQP